MECLFLFQWYKNYKNRPRNARVVVENNVASFFRTRCRNRQRSSSNLFIEDRFWYISVHAAASPVRSESWVRLNVTTDGERSAIVDCLSLYVDVLWTVDNRSIWQHIPAITASVNDEGYRDFAACINESSCIVLALPRGWPKEDVRICHKNCIKTKGIKRTK